MNVINLANLSKEDMTLYGGGFGNDHFTHPDFKEGGIYRLRTSVFPPDYEGDFKVVEIHNESRATTIIVVECKDGSHQDFYYNGAAQVFKPLTPVGAIPDWKLDDFGTTPDILKDEVILINEFWSSVGETVENNDEYRVLEKYGLLLNLVKKQKEYISLLGEELDELVPLASIHGWNSSRVKTGERIRSEIESLENSFNGK